MAVKYEHAHVTVSKQVVNGSASRWSEALLLLGDAGWKILGWEFDQLKDWYELTMTRPKPLPCGKCGGPREKCRPGIDPKAGCEPRAFWIEVDFKNRAILATEEHCVDCGDLLEDSPSGQLQTFVRASPGLQCAVCAMGAVCDPIKNDLTPVVGVCAWCNGTKEVPNFIMPGTRPCRCAYP